MKMSSKSKLTSILTLIICLIGSVSVSLVSAAQPVTRIRAVHLSPDAPPVDIYLDDEGSGIQSLTFGNISGWVEVPAGTHTLTVVPAGAPLESAAVGPVRINLKAGGWETIAAIGSIVNNSLNAVVIPENLVPATSEEAQITIFHGIEGAPAVDILQGDGTRLASNLTFGKSASLTLPAGAYNFQIVPVGDPNTVILSLQDTNLSAQSYYFVAAANTVEAPQVVLTSNEYAALRGLFRDTIPDQTIAEIVASDSRFTTLETALENANLVDTLNGSEAFTVFAPTNAAFAKLPTGTLNALLENPELLTSTLLHHVAGGRALAADVVGQTSIATLNGNVSIRVTEDGVFINDTVKLVVTDIEATNGVIHAIDTVLLDPVTVTTP